MNSSNKTDHPLNLREQNVDSQVRICVFTNKKVELNKLKSLINIIAIHLLH